MGAGACTPTMPSGIEADDILILSVVTENQASTLTTANGFAQVTNSPQSAGTANVDPANRITVYWKRAVGSDAAPVTDDSGDYNYCQVWAFIGVKTSGNPWTDSPVGGNDSGANDTSANIPGTTTTTADNLIVLIQGHSVDIDASDQCGAVTNANLANITTITNGESSFNKGGGHCLITGEKATAGAYATSTLTLVTTSYKGAMSIPLEGASAGAAAGRWWGGFR